MLMYMWIHLTYVLVSVTVASKLSDETKVQTERDIGTDDLSPSIGNELVAVSADHVVDGGNQSAAAKETVLPLPQTTSPAGQPIVPQLSLDSCESVVYDVRDGIDGVKFKNSNGQEGWTPIKNGIAATGRRRECDGSLNKPHMF